MKVEVGQYRLNQKNNLTYEVIECIDDWYFKCRYLGNHVEVVWYVGRIHMDAVWLDEPVVKPKRFNELLNQVWS